MTALYSTSYVFITSMPTAERQWYTRMDIPFKNFMMSPDSYSFSLLPFFPTLLLVIQTTLCKCSSSFSLRFTDWVLSGLGPKIGQRSLGQLTSNHLLGVQM